MKKFLAVVLVLSFGSVGCTGSFQLTRNVYDFHRSQDNKWADELLFLGAVILPVYGLSTLADAVLFNTIEFWTGDNPLLTKGGDATHRFVKKDGEEVEIRYDEATDQIFIQAENATGESPLLVLERDEFGVVAKDADGNVLYTAVKNNDGEVRVYDENVDLVRSYSAEKIASAKEKYLR